jgi:hypothetical protein
MVKIMKTYKFIVAIFDLGRPMTIYERRLALTQAAREGTRLFGGAFNDFSMGENIEGFQEPHLLQAAFPVYENTEYRMITDAAAVMLAVLSSKYKIVHLRGYKLLEDR